MTTRAVTVPTKPDRKLTLADIRLRRGQIVAVPVWPYRKKRSTFPMREVESPASIWRNVRSRLQRDADSEHARAMESHEQFMAALLAKDKAALEYLALRRKWGVDATKPPERREVHIPLTFSVWPWGRGWDRRTCKVCGSKFYSADRTCRCTDACETAHKSAAVARYRAKHGRKIKHVEHGPRSCAQCRQDFMPKRQDARFCSGRCRVAAHRAAKEAA